MPARTSFALALILLLGSPALARAQEPDRFDEDEIDAEEGEEAGEREHGPLRLSLEELERLASGTVDRKVRGRVTLGTTAPPGMNWTELGPRPIANEYWSGLANGAGRVTSIAVDPRNGQVAYLSAAQGGVWKTVNGGAVWTPVTENLSSLASGALGIDPAHPDVVYYATGEQNYSIDSFYGDGIFRSEDLGATWAKVATKTEAGSYIARIEVAPDNSDILYVASSRGVVCSYDRGASWQLMLSGGYCNDLVVDTANPGTLYAALYAGGIFKSVNHGGTWSQLTGGLPTTGFQRINMAIARSNTLVLYASFVSAANSSLLGMYRTADGGTTWTPLPATPNYLGTQGWYDNCVVVDPANPDRCLAGGVFPYGGAGTYGIIRTVDGGASWTDVTTSSGGVRVHPDQHHLTYGPDGVLWVANDGGVWKSANHGTNWTNCNASLGITQFYTVAKSPTDPAGIVGGTQDNGSVRYAGTLSWPQVIAGDGGPAAYRADDPSQFFTTYIYLDPLYKWTSAGASLGVVTGPWGAADDRADWATGALTSDPNTPNTILAGTYRVWRSTNGGGAWTAISGDLTGGMGVLRSIAAPLGSPGTLWVTTSDGRVQVTPDNGTNWFLKTAGLPGSALPKLVVDPAHPLTAWVISDRASGDRVFRTVNGGDTWDPVTGTLPQGLRPLALAVDFRLPVPRLHVGTDYGVYVSTDNGATWIKANVNLPDIAVYDLALETTSNVLIAATHGRGMWRAVPDVVGPSVTVLVPNGGESWEANLPHDVTWNATDPAGVDTVTILFSGNGGASFDLTIAAGVPNTGSFAWTPPDTVLSACRVRVVAYDAWRNAAFDASNASFAIVKSVAVGEAGAGFDLRPAWPNPGRAPIALRFVTPQSARVSLAIYGLSGRRVRLLADGERAAGVYDVAWDGRDDAGRAVPAGLYFAHMTSGTFAQSSRFALLK
jgi:photosystem II stability/assembly factor-like uncharacterized protein